MTESCSRDLDREMRGVFLLTKLLALDAVSGGFLVVPGRTVIEQLEGSPLHFLYVARGHPIHLTPLGLDYLVVLNLGIV